MRVLLARSSLTWGISLVLVEASSGLSGTSCLGLTNWGFTISSSPTRDHVNPGKNAKMEKNKLFPVVE